MLLKLWKWKWIISAALCFLLLFIIPASVFENYYSNGFFLYVRKFMDNTFGKLPFPSIYIFLIIIFIVVFKWVLHFFREKPQPLALRLFKILSFSGFLITWFFILWGFNYGRIPIEDKLNLSVQPLSMNQLINETKLTADQLVKIRGLIKKDTNSLPQILFINNAEEKSRKALNTALSGFNYPNSTKIRGRFVIDDMFLIFSIGGLYLPFVGEGNVDDAVFYSKKPFYLIHEMAHGNGFTQEADCNFLSYVSCVKSNNLSLQYSGELNYLLYLLSEIKNRDEPLYDSVKKNLPPSVLKDLMEIKKHNEEHQFKTGFLGDVINNVYLKLLGIDDGIKNYDKMVLMIYAWKQKGI